MAAKKTQERFVCARCGKCCRLDGYVRVRPDEIKRFAAHLKISVAESRRRYVTTESWGNGREEILLDHPGTTDCIFLEDGNRCIVHPVKPEQCRTFPVKWKRSGANMYCAALRASDEKEK